MEYILPIILVAASVYLIKKYLNKPIITDEDDISIVQRDEVLKQLGVKAYHSKGVKGEGIKVGVIDGAILPHKDLKNKVNRINYNDNLDPKYTDEHGTHVAGIISNIVPEAEIYSCDIFDTESSELGESFHNMVKNNVKVVNASISMGKDGYLRHNPDADYDDDTHLYDGEYLTISQIYDKLEEAGVIVVIAAGNEDSVREGAQKISLLTEDAEDFNYQYGKKVKQSTMSNWPIVVTSCKLPNDENSDELTSGFSSFNSLNKSVDIMSYGDDITSYGTTNNYIKMSGTSMASPQVTGCIALIYDAIIQSGEYSDLSPKEMAKLVKSYVLNMCTVRDVDGMVKYLPHIADMARINGFINSQRSDLNSYIKDNSEAKPVQMVIGTASTDSDVPPQFAELHQDIVLYMEKYNHLDLNNKGVNFDHKDMSFIELINAYDDMSLNIRYKYTTLSLGCGILSLPESATLTIEEKEPFDYGEGRTPQQQV